MDKEAKRLKLTTLSRLFFHQRRSLKLKFTQQSWNRFCEAAKWRQDSIYDRLKDYISGEREYYQV